MDQEITRVAAVMGTSMHTVSGLVSVQEAIKSMNHHKISSLVIERRDENDEYGLVTIQDIAGKVVAINRSTQRTSVYEIMTKPVLTIDHRMNIKYAIRLLANLNLEHSLVSDCGKITGFVSLRDLVLYYTEKEKSPDQL